MKKVWELILPEDSKEITPAALIAATLTEEKADIIFVKKESYRELI